ncbi:MAG: NPCBM/NEW2 domain-containing protein [Planctomycetes bacterium]|nr:NPCBM/NEW2 domain-containing protein [Planctomycetota bacterium]
MVLEARSGATRRVPLEGFETRSLAELEACLVRFEGLAAPPASSGRDGCEVHLVGDRGLVRGELLGGDGEDLEVRLYGGARLGLGIAELASLRVPGRVPDDWTEALVPADEGDRLYRARGLGLDRIDGTVERFSAEGVTLDSALGSKLFPWSEVAALFVEALEEERAPVRGEPVVVDLYDGSRLPAGFVRLADDGLDLVTSGGRGLRLPLGAVSEVFLEGAGLAFLSDLEPAESATTSLFGDDLGMTWPVRRDRSTTGGPLTAGGRTWTRGLGVHAPSRLVYALGGAWSGLRGSVAVDDEVTHLPARGSVRFRVHGDDVVLWESAVLHGGDPPVAFPQLDLTGVERLVLEVDMADELAVGDRADWLRPVLVR